MPVEGHEKISNKARGISQEERKAIVNKQQNKRGWSRRQQAMEGMNEETVTAMDEIFQAKLATVRASEQRLAQISDPYARKALEGMIQQERQQLLQLAELIEIVEESPEMGGITRRRKQMMYRLKSPDSKNFAYGVGVAVLASLLFPTMKEGISPLFGKIMNSINDLGEHARGVVSGVRENMEDFIAEAEFERLKQSIDTDIGIDGQDIDPIK